jgi:hypothetical protein
VVPRHSVTLSRVWWWAQNWAQSRSEDYHCGLHGLVGARSLFVVSPHPSPRAFRACQSRNVVRRACPAHDGGNFFIFSKQFFLRGPNFTVCNFSFPVPACGVRTPLCHPFFAIVITFTFNHLSLPVVANRWQNVQAKFTVFSPDREPLSRAHCLVMSGRHRGSDQQMI